MAKHSTPPYRADHVGSLLRPAAVKEARRRYAEGALDAAGLKAVEDREIERIVSKQRELGLRGITDGELRRSWWHLDFLWGLDGIVEHDADFGMGFVGAKPRTSGLRAVTDGELRRSWWHLDFLWGLDGIAEHHADFAIGFVGATPRTAGVRIDGKIGFSAHPFVAHYRHLHERMRDGVAKLTIPSPSALLGRPVLPLIDARVYPTRAELYEDLGAAYRAAVRAFAAAGCRYLQLDEVFIAMLCDEKYREKMVARGDDPDALLHLYAQLINTAVADAPANMTVTLHLCRGNFKSTYMGAGGYETVEEVLFNEIDVDGYFMEYDDERSGGFEPLRALPKRKRVALGLVTTKRGALESKDELKRRIDAAAKFTDPDQLCLAPQCGFASTEEGNLLTEDEQWAKLARIVEVAGEVWGEA
jgi:5-methyltetrahydropteroyltriglutamate--homocysteine methyltransferase